MARKMAATVETEVTAETEQEQEQAHDQSSVAYLRAEKARIDAQLKAAREAERAERGLRTTDAPSNATKALTAKVARLIKSGVSESDALDRVLSTMRDAISVRLHDAASES